MSTTVHLPDHFTTLDRHFVSGSARPLRDPTYPGLLTEFRVLDVLADGVVSDGEFHAETQFGIHKGLTVELAEDEPTFIVHVLYSDPHSFRFTGGFVSEHGLDEIAGVNGARERHRNLRHTYSIGL